MAGYITEVGCTVLVLCVAREAGCSREVAALHSDHLRQVPHQSNALVPRLIAHIVLTMQDNAVVF